MGAFGGSEGERVYPPRKKKRLEHTIENKKEYPEKNLNPRCGWQQEASDSRLFKTN